ncbi:hypothetical protein [uncultured Roseobacter sp.]|uniref:hypothetical protein n=1 Tax=uncultured Roseobacter sp. TaxID=114847 RepID=UPI0026395AD3|nr:hypothetical protein [uncultured Roseobacter sp.]
MDHQGCESLGQTCGEADIYLTVVKTSDAPGHKDMVMSAIPADAPGISFGLMYDTPSYNFLPIGQGFQGALMAIDIARVSIASDCCEPRWIACCSVPRTARCLVVATLIYLDGARWMLGEVATDLEVSRLLYCKPPRRLARRRGR